MTGYGRGMAERSGRRAVVEIRAVNHRFLDVKLRGSALEPAIEDRVVSRVRKACERGSLAISLRLVERGALAAMTVDRAAAKKVLGELTEMARELGLAQPVDLALLCAQPGVLVPAEEDPDVEAIWQCIDVALEQAVAQLVAMRETEGAALARDLGARVDTLAELVTSIAESAGSGPEAAHQRLSERLDRLLQKHPKARNLVGGLDGIDESRLMQEVVLLADRADVTEELVRLRSHLDQLRSIMGQARGAIGRRLEFLVQEIGRELNTVASKSQSGDIAHTVVEAKAELEKVREQVQNIE